ncbi:HAD family hydrolase [Paenibacillus sp. ClWae2A]|uniref:HAD family hydrolase n=1 Tax=Paenibacillus sp. ClWae2A TaxID=3057177 RepID=UPI0028F59D14|nr:HAD family hydrolase [Paenibacillus sp. ClWae2A]MDT9722442.1 HAD family hydrolase [Paenibacillus sp. ClWae2A]
MSKMTEKGNPSVIAIDLDGTIVGKSNVISLNILEKLNVLKNRMPIIIATGRTLIGSRDILNQFQPKFPVIFFDGRLIYQPSGDILLLSHCLPSKLVSLVKLRFGSSHYIVEECTELIPHTRESGISYVMSFGIPRSFISKNISGINPIYMYLKPKHRDNDEDYCHLYSIAKKYSAEVYVTGNGWTVIRMQNHTKCTALEYLGDKYGFTMSDVLAFGDGENDRDMLKNAAISIVMFNASESLKKIATIIAGSVDEDGALLFLEKILENGKIDLE